jgi:LuxR family transcriptional regulator
MSPREPHPVHDRDPSIAVLVPGADAMANAADPRRQVVDWVRLAGFTGLTCFIRADEPPPLGPEVWSTWDDAWVRRWTERGYASVDPRIVATTHQSLPCLWDGGTLVPRGALSRFLDEAARVGIRSGVAVTLRTGVGRSVVAFDSPTTPVGTERHASIVASLRDLFWIANAVHAWRMAVGPAGRRAPTDLTHREHACLAMSARGLTSRDIGQKLGITPRTVDFHVRNVVTKLGALNRREAIAKAAARGWL